MLSSHSETMSCLALLQSMHHTLHACQTAVMRGSFIFFAYILSIHYQDLSGLQVVKTSAEGQSRESSSWGLLDRKQMPVALTCGVFAKTLVVDPTDEEEQLMQSTTNIALDSSGRLMGKPSLSERLIVTQSSLVSLDHSSAN